MEKKNKSSVFSRTEMLIGKDALEKLNKCRVAVFGVGGVGGYAVEALARSGVGTIDVIDSDVVDISNINRQIIATSKTVGRKKVEVGLVLSRDGVYLVTLRAYLVQHAHVSSRYFPNAACGRDGARPSPRG